MLRKSKIFIALLLVLLIALPSFAAGPAVPYGTSGAQGNWPKPLYDWFHRYIIDPHCGAAGGYAHPKAPFDTPLFNYHGNPTNPNLAPDTLLVHPPFLSGEIGCFHTTNQETANFLDSLPKDFMRWDMVGNITTYDHSGDVPPVHNLGYPLVVFSKGPNGPVFQPEDVRALKKPVYFVQPTNHGGEPAGAEAAISIIKRLALGEIKTDDGKNVLDKISVVIMPRINIDGYYWQYRGTHSERGINITDHNRDGTMLASPQVRMNSMLLNQYQPHFGYDSHQMGWTTGFPSGTVRYYASGVYGQGDTTNTTSVTVANNTVDGSGTFSLARHYSTILWAPIDDPSKFANTPQVLSDWQDKSMDFMVQKLDKEMHMHIFPYALGTGSSYARDPRGIDVNIGTVENPVVVNYPGDRPVLYRGYDVVPDEGYGDGFLGLKQMVAWCMESPSASGDGFTVRMFNNYTAMKEQIRFLAHNAEQIYKDVEAARLSFKTDNTKIALWNRQDIDGRVKITRADGSEYQFQTRRQRTLKIGPVRTAVPSDMILNPANPDYAFEFDVPFWIGNRERLPGRQVVRPFAYIIDPNHVAEGNRIFADLVAFKIGYTGSPIYRLKAPVTVQVEANRINTIQNLNIGNSAPTVIGTPVVSDWDENGYFKEESYAKFSMQDGGDINDTYLGSGDTAGGSFGIQSQRISHVTVSTITKTFPAGSYVVPIQGEKANWGAMHAWFMLEALGKRNLGNSYWRFRPNNDTAVNLARQWPYFLWQHYFPVEVGGFYPSYRYMSANYDKTMQLERAFAEQPMMKGATFSDGFAMNLTTLKEKGFNTGNIEKIGLGYHFMAEGTFDISKAEEPMTMAVLNAPATKFEVMLPKEYDGVALRKWLVYDFSKRAFVEAVTYKSARNGSNMVTLSGSLIGNGHDAVLVASLPREVLADAWVEKLNGNKNNLYITVTELYPNGAKPVVFEAKISIDNNAAGTYQVGPYKVYVDTKGNTQIRACYIVQ